MKVLVVDDEQSLLNGLRRLIGDDYDLDTAISGPVALEKMRTEGPYAVVVTDMRMPEMNGIELIQHAREHAPDTVYIMLTGNQDQGTAIAALNEGQVFRFLNKPCSTQAIEAAINAGLRQYQLVMAEKELLHQTFCGAVSVLTDIIEIAQPRVFGQAPNVQQLVEVLRTAVEAQDRWEFKLATRLGLLGFALMPSEAWRDFETGAPTDQRTQELLDTALRTSARLLERIPRLRLLTEMIRQQDVDGSCRAPRSEEEADLINVGATLLRVALQWNAQLQVGVANSVALRELRERFPNLHPAFAEAIESREAPANDLRSVEIEFNELKVGMVLAEDVVTNDDLRLLRKGLRLSEAMIEHLTHQYAARLGSTSLEIVASSCPDYAEEAVGA